MGTERVRIAAPAKLNLHLGIHPGRDERGYHRADSVMVAVSLADELLVWEESGREPGLRMSEDVGVDPRKNTVWVAAQRLCEEYGHEPCFQVEVTKRTPAQSGLGGSSSDAAAMLLALCELWGEDPADEHVVTVARGVGADVPFFLNLAPSFLDGAGDVLRESFPPLDGVPVALVRPRGGVSTAEAYRAFDLAPSEPPSPEGMCRALRAGDVRTVVDALHNNLADAAARVEGGIALVEGWLREQEGVLAAQVTGSGSCVFAICEDEVAASRVAGRASSELGLWSRATRTVSRRGGLLA